MLYSIRFRKCLLAFTAAVFVACGGSETPVEIPVEITQVPDTTLGAGDVFDIRVFEEENLSATFRVASDGTIDFPLLGSLQIAGKTPSGVAELVEEGLREQEYLKNPQVSVFVKEYSSKKVSVFGQVKKPGTFKYEDGMSIVEAISLAGGFTTMSRKNDTAVIRNVDGKKKRFTVKVELVGQGKAPNFVLQPGDIIFVPERVF